MCFWFDGGRWLRLCLEGDHVPQADVRNFFQERREEWNKAWLVAVMFLLIFAQSIFGSRTTHSQLRKLLGETERMNDNLERIARHLAGDAKKPAEKRPEDPAGEGAAKQ